MKTITEEEWAFYRALGANLRRARKLGSWTQRMVARAMGTCPPEVTGWERGNHRMSAIDLARFAQLMCVSIDFLIDDEVRRLAEVARLASDCRHWRAAA